MTTILSTIHEYYTAKFLSLGPFGITLVPNMTILLPHSTLCHSIPSLPFTILSNPFCPFLAPFHPLFHVYLSFQVFLNHSYSINSLLIHILSLPVQSAPLPIIIILSKLSCTPSLKKIIIKVKDSQSEYLN